MLSLTEWIRKAIKEVRTDTKKLSVRNGRMIVARQNPFTKSIWASLVRAGAVQSKDIVWLFEDLGYRRNWIAFIDFVHKRIHVLDRKRWPNIKPQKGWTITFEKPDPNEFKSLKR